MRYTLRQLEVFLAIAHHENLTRAAHELALSQSAASSALKDLETQFDVLLFDRIGKRLQLNEQGRLLRPQAEVLMAQARDLEASLVRHADIGSLKVGATLTIGNYLAVNLIAQFMAEHPGTVISLDVANTKRIVEEILNFERDVGLIEGEINHPDLHIEAWMHDELAVFCHPSHPLAAQQASGQPIAKEQLISQDWIVREAGSGTRQAFDHAFHGTLSRLNIRLELQHTEAIKRAVEANLGLGCLSRITLMDAFRRGSLVQLNIAELDLKRQLYLILHKHKYRSAGIEAWLELCRNATVQALIPAK